MLSNEGGKYLLSFTREALHQYLQHKRVIDRPRKYPAELDGYGGVLIELYKNVPGTNARELKGSAAVLELNKNMLDNAVNAALAALNDKRFAGLKLDVLPVLNIEVSVVDGMKDITSKDAKDYSRKIALGTDGLYMEKGIMKGILMPKVPVERKWTVRESLENLCLKAGLLNDAWADPAARIYSFRPQVFRE